MKGSERSAGAVIFRNTKAGRVYLLLRHPDVPNGRVYKPTRGHWAFPKGHIEAGEKTEDAARREIREETGIKKVPLLADFKEAIRYFVDYGAGKRLKLVMFFLAETKQKRIILSPEHQAYVWLPYKEARQKLTYQDTKRVLTAAEKFLKKYDRVANASKPKPTARR